MARAGRISRTASPTAGWRPRAGLAVAVIPIFRKGRVHRLALTLAAAMIVTVSSRVRPGCCSVPACRCLVDGAPAARSALARVPAILLSEHRPSARAPCCCVTQTAPPCCRIARAGGGAARSMMLYRGSFQPLATVLVLLIISVAIPTSRWLIVSDCSSAELPAPAALIFGSTRSTVSGPDGRRRGWSWLIVAAR